MTKNILGRGWSAYVCSDTMVCMRRLDRDPPHRIGLFGRLLLLGAIAELAGLSHNIGINQAPSLLQVQPQLDTGVCGEPHCSHPLDSAEQMCTLLVRVSSKWAFLTRTNPACCCGWNAAWDFATPLVYRIADISCTCRTTEMR